MTVEIYSSIAIFLCILSVFTSLIVHSFFSYKAQNAKERIWWEDNVIPCTLFLLAGSIGWIVALPITIFIGGMVGFWMLLIKVVYPKLDELIKGEEDV